MFYYYYLHHLPIVYSMYTSGRISNSSAEFHPKRKKLKGWQKNKK